MPVSTDLRVYDERALFALGNKDLKDLCNHHGIWPAKDDPGRERAPSQGLVKADYVRVLLGKAAAPGQQPDGQQPGAEPPDLPELEPGHVVALVERATDRDGPIGVLHKILAGSWTPHGGSNAAPAYQVAWGNDREDLQYYTREQLVHHPVFAVQTAPVSAYVYAVRRVCTRRSRDDARSLPSRAPLAGLVTTNKAVWCPGAVTTPRVADRRPGHLLSYSQEESRTFVGLDDECLESFCKAEGRTSLPSYQPADSALWPLPGYADEETRVHLRPATTTAAAGAAGRRRRPLCDLGTGNFTRPPLPFTTRFGYLNARHGSETSTPAARRFVRLWTPVSDTTCVGTVRIPDTNARHSAAHVRLQAAPVSAYVYAVRRV